MAVIRDIMPAFELFQPATIEDALGLLDQYGSNAWVMAGGLDSFDWLKDRIKRPSVVVDLSQVKELVRHPAAQRRPRDRRDDHADRSGAQSDRQGEVQHSVEGRRSGGLAADPQPGNHRRQRVAGRALLVLPQRLEVLSRGREHLLRRYADGHQPRARHSGRGPLRGRESFGFGAGADRARRENGDSQRRRASAWSMPRTTSSDPAPTSPA